jgi:hypothetical protein
LKSERNEALGLLALATTAFFLHGYHPYSEDAETYLPGIERVLNPRLFPVGSEYFQLHSHLTWFPQLIAWPVQLLHLPLPWALLLWQFAAFLLFLWGCLELARNLFPGSRACWGAVGLVAALFTMPVAGTALYLMDPFLNPRNIIAFAQVFCVARVIERRYLQAAMFMAFAISIHPLMSAFSATFCLLLFCVDRWPARWKAPVRVRTETKTKTETDTKTGTETEAPLPVVRAAGILSPVAKLFDAPTDAYDRVAGTHRYQFLTRWTWYEMLGAIAPMFLLWWFASIARARRLRNLELICRALVVYAVVYFAAGMVVSIPRRLELFSLLQPMRSLYLEYVLMLLAGGGLLGEYVLRKRAWRWIALFLPLSSGMLWAQRSLYPASAHVEWPSAQPRNPWVQAFEWIRDNTPEQAIFALDPYYMQVEGEDANGFRAIAQRSQLADGVKDSGVVELFPQIGDSWLAQVQAQTGINTFQAQDFERLKSQYRVSWVVLRQPAHAGLDCPYQNQAVVVCRLP